jgi:hypothetical protein
MYEDEVLIRIKKITQNNSESSNIEICMSLIDDSDELSLSKQKLLDKSDFIVWKELALPIYAFYINEIISLNNIIVMKVYAVINKTFVSNYLFPFDDLD